MDRLEELLAKDVSALSASELKELRGLLGQATDTLAADMDTIDEAKLEQITRVANAAEASAAEVTRRETALAETSARARDALGQGEPVAASAKPRPVPLSQVRQQYRPGA